MNKIVKKNHNFTTVGLNFEYHIASPTVELDYLKL